MRLRTFVSAAALAVASAAQGQPQGLNVVSKVEVRDAGSSVVISIHGSKPPNFTTFSMMDPPRFVIDFSESRFRDVPEDMPVRDGLIKVIKNLSYGSDANSIARVMIAFEMEVDPPDVQAVGENLLVKVAKPPGLPVASAAPADGAAQRRAREEAAAAEARARAEQEAKARSEAAALAAAQAEVAAKAKAKAEEQARASQEAQARGADEARIRAEAEAQVRADAAADAKAKADVLAAQQAEATARAQAEAKAKADEEARAAQQTQATAAEEARAKAEQEAQTRAQAEAQARAQAEAEAMARAEREAKPEAAAPSQVAALPPVEPKTERAPAPPEQRLSRGPSQVREVGFKMMPDASRVFIRTSNLPEFTIQDAGENLIRLELANTRVKRRNDTRFLDTSFFQSVVAMVTPKRQGSSYVLEIKLKQRVAYQQKVEGDMLAIDFERPASMRSSVPPRSQPSAADAAAAPAAPAEPAPAPEQAEGQGEGTVPPSPGVTGN